MSTIQIDPSQRTQHLDGHECSQLPMLKTVYSDGEKSHMAIGFKNCKAFFKQKQKKKTHKQHFMIIVVVTKDNNDITNNTLQGRDYPN